MKSKKPSSNKNLIMRIYLYIFIGVGLVMMSIGLYGIGQNIYKSKLLSKYPLGGYEQRCEYLDGAPRAMPIGKNIKLVEETPEVKEYNQKLFNDCEAKLDEERETKKVTDFYNSLITFTIGALLFTGHLVVNLKTARKL